LDKIEQTPLEITVHSSQAGDKQTKDVSMDVNGHTVADGAATALREMILSGELRPAARVHQDQLADRLGLSRTPLRTALATLANDGLLVYEANRGYRVREFSVESIGSVFEIRSVLEAQACRIAGRLSCSEEMLDRLDTLVRTGDDILASGRLDPKDLPAWRRMNVEFHEAIIQAAMNPWLEEFVARTHNVPMVSDRVILWDDYEIIKRSHDDHHRIAKCLRQGDGERAAAIMHEHVSFAGDLLTERLSKDPEAAFEQFIGSPHSANSNPKEDET
jgi:GntR family transcriptional regulator of vanillate catabolism